MSVQFARHYFTVGEYERMGQTGVFAPDDRVELIEGEIIEMSPVGSRHAACVDLVARLLNEQVGDSAIVRVQSPIVLDDFSEPQPDIALLKFRDDFYRNAHPRPEDVLLVIEVSDTTVEYDRHVKVPAYARAGIPEALIFNLPDDQLEYYAQPEAGSYQVTYIFKRGDHFESSNVPGVVLDLDAILG
jgi:Uma2 family endonuclease